MVTDLAWKPHELSRYRAGRQPDQTRHDCSPPPPLTPCLYILSTVWTRLRHSRANIRISELDQTFAEVNNMSALLKDTAGNDRLKKTC